MYKRLLILLLCLPLLSNAQTLNFFGQYPQYSQTGPISKRLNYQLFLSSTIDALAQTIDNQRYPATNLQVYAQPSLLYTVSPHVQVGLGYAYVSHNLFGIRVSENRVWAQTMLTHGISQTTLKLNHRLRYEERYPFRESTQKWSLAQLARYYVGVTLPLFDAKKSKTGFYAAVSNEAFLCFSGAKNGPVSAKNVFYGEDWVYGGIGYNTGKWGKVELGYQYQDLVRNPAQDHRHLHLVQVQWATNFSLTGIADWLLTPPF
ncbi:DUF2490 domain-containing protein [Fibrella sp. HMF5335]|uniref:DUF2490 domain-containing protein n=1 Tax=Fibrella rubiginis TaxID=2817060 RepID=A0A939GG38_9BACT|nr:DUF2490 domain-containing protein [Fibrella rubiginis]MBO0936096.1 DUF2490 domain-containing protein [Fibrella rubiginis]